MQRGTCLAVVVVGLVCGSVAQAGQMLSLMDVPFGPPVTVTFSAASATVNQGGFPITNAIDGVLTGGGWAVNSTPAIGVLTNTAAIPIGDSRTALTFDLNHLNSCCGDHVLGHFRISATTDAVPTLGGSWTVLSPLTATRTSGGGITINPGVGPVGSILLADNNTTNDVITATFDLLPSQFSSPITGFRVEAIRQAGNLLPLDGPGIAGNANFVLTEFTAQYQLFVVALAPEPSSWALMGLALAGMGTFTWYRQRKRA